MIYCKDNSLFHSNVKYYNRGGEEKFRETKLFLYSLYLAVSERTDRGDRRRRKVKPDKDA